MRAELASKEKRKAAKKGKTDEDGNRVERDDMDEEDPDSITAVRPTTEQRTGTRWYIGEGRAGLAGRSTQ
jgi:hypothetical protein